jgi:hypothetical protein
MSVNDCRSLGAAAKGSAHRTQVESVSPNLSTPPSSGRPKGRCAPFGLPLMSNYKGFPTASSDSRP